MSRGREWAAERPGWGSHAERGNQGELCADRVGAAFVTVQRLEVAPAGCKIRLRGLI